MGRKSLSDERKKEIVKAFYRLAQKEGLENASIAKTAELIDINPSLIIHYFKTKEYLLYGLIDFILDKYLLIFHIPASAYATPHEKLLKVIDKIFSRKWNVLFDDSVAYSCYALAFRNISIKKKYKELMDVLRKNLADLIIDCNNNGQLSIDNPQYAAELIFILVDGAYYYLSMINDKKEYANKLENYKKEAIKILSLLEE